MTESTIRRTSSLLHVVLGLIIAIEGALALIHSLSIHHDWHLIAFGGVEVAAALLFIWRRTMLVGGCCLFCAYLIAAGVHVLRGEFPSEHLVYAVAVLFVMIHGRGWRSLDEQAAA